ncbi:uncharacterized protein METZ01_LOCUS94297 [marine metagenome]|uniref:Uncharacterized protein n=1 Tax=marine metagenome TaxID=408172 RepID=A0A381VPJ9_9ZZZZ
MKITHNDGSHLLLSGQSKKVGSDVLAQASLLGSAQNQDRR